MATQTVGKEQRSHLADSILEAGKRAFDPSADPTTKVAAQREFHKLIDGKGAWALLPALNALIKPNVAPSWLQPELMKALTLMPLRPTGVRGTLEFVFSVHPSSTLKVSEASEPQKKGANITQEALAVATRILTSPPSSVSPEVWFTTISPQLFLLIDGQEGPELMKAAAQIVMFGVLGRKQFGAPGAPGWTTFVDPILSDLNPSRRQTKKGSDNESPGSPIEIIDLHVGEVLVSAKELCLALRRLSTLIHSTPYPAQTRRIIDPVIPQLWALSSWSSVNPQCQEKYCTPARSLLQTFLKISTTKLELIIQNLLYIGENLEGKPRWKFQATEKGDIEIIAWRVESGQYLDELNWSEIQEKSISLTNLLAESCKSDEISSIFLDLLRRWLSLNDHQKLAEVSLQAQDESRPEDQRKQLNEMTLLQTMMEKIPEKLISRVEQVLELICQILDNENLDSQPDEVVAVALSLLNLVVTAPSFKKSNLKTKGLQVIETALEQLSTQSRPDVSPTARNLSVLLRYIDEASDSEIHPVAPSDRQIEDRNTYKLAISYITQADNPPPVRSEGINLLSGLVSANSPVLDIQSILVLLSSLLQESEDFINLRVIKLLTQLASKHPNAVVQELIEHYLDAKELATTDTRLRFGEALVQVIERLGETFAGDVAKQISETLLSIAGRRGHRPKTEARQARDERLQKLKKKKAEDAWGGDVPDLGDDKTEEDQAKNDILAQIVQGWESKRGTEDVRMRSSALSIFSVGVETNIAGMGPTVVSASVDLSVNVLTLEREMEKGILRRAAVLLILSFVKALADAREAGRRIGFGLTDQSREDILRTLKYIAVTDNDGLVQQHAKDVIESLDNWQMTAVLPESQFRGSSLTRLVGLNISSDQSSLGSGSGHRPRIEEIE